jgi:hypothetical protein
VHEGRPDRARDAGRTTADDDTTADGPAQPAADPAVPATTPLPPLWALAQAAAPVAASAGTAPVDAVASAPGGAAPTGPALAAAAALAIAGAAPTQPADPATAPAPTADAAAPAAPLVAAPATPQPGPSTPVPAPASAAPAPAGTADRAAIAAQVGAGTAVITDVSSSPAVPVVAAGPAPPPQAASTEAPIDGPATPAPDAGSSLQVAPAASSAGSTGSQGADAGDQRDQGSAPSAAQVQSAGAPVVQTPAAAQPVQAAASTAPPPVAAQLLRPVTLLRGGPDGTHSMTVVLTPETLGPVQVQVTLDRGTVDLQLRGAHEHGRTALMAALPELRRDLESAGLTCSRLDVDRDTGGSWTAQQHPQGDGGGRPGQGETRPRGWARPADLGEGRPALTLTSTASTGPSTGLDVRV